MWSERLAAAVGGMCLFSAAYVSFLSQTARLPPELYGNTRQWASELAIVGVPVELFGVVWFFFVVLVSTQRTHANYVTLNSVLFWTGAAATGVGFGLLLRADFAPWPIIWATVLAAYVTARAWVRPNIPFSTGLRSFYRSAISDLRRLTMTPLAIALWCSSIVLFLGLAQYASLAASLIGSAEREAQLATWFESQPRLVSEGLVDNTKVRVVVFSDYQCPICTIVVPEFSKVVGRYRDGGYPQVELVLRDFPLDPACNQAVPAAIHPVACEAAAALRFIERVAGESAADTARKTLYATRGRFGVADVEALLGELGLMDRFEREGDTDRAEVAHDAAAGIRLGVNGTPTVFIDGRLTRSVTPDSLMALIGHRLRGVKSVAIDSGSFIEK